MRGPGFDPIPPDVCSSDIQVLQDRHDGKAVLCCEFSHRLRNLGDLKCDDTKVSVYSGFLNKFHSCFELMALLLSDLITCLRRRSELRPHKCDCKPKYVKRTKQHMFLDLSVMAESYHAFACR